MRRLLSVLVLFCCGLAFASLPRNAPFTYGYNRNGQTTLFSHCGCGALENITDPAHNTTTYGRDYLGSVTSILSATGGVTTASLSIERDVLGQPFHVSSDWGLDLHLAHNYVGMLTGVTNSAGTVFSVVYDMEDRPVSVTDAQGATVTTTFDPLGRVLTRSNAAGQFEQNGYSAKGISAHSDALGHLTPYGYDSAGRLATITNPNYEVTQLGYDPAGDIVSLTDGRNNTKTWRYDAYGRQVAELNANGLLVRTNGYDANSRLTAQWTAAKGLSHFDRDHNGNVLSARYPHSTVNYTFDPLDRLWTMSDAVGNHTFTYRDLGAFESALASETGPWATVSYAYSGPNLTNLSLDSWHEAIVLDTSLRPSTITSPAGTFTYDYKGAGRQLASLTMPGSATTFGYNDVGEQNLIQVQASGQTVDYHGYDYNGNGWITAARRRASPNNPQSTINYSFGYDNIGQLLSAQAYESNSTLRLNENLGFGYDPSGNLASRTANDLVQTFSSDALNQLASITRSGTLTVSGSLTGAVTTLGVNGKAAAIYSDATFATTSGLTLRDGNNLFVTAGSNTVGELVLSTITSNRLPATVNFNYDLNGNLLTDGQRVFEYDEANRLVSVTVSNAYRSEFVYDGLGRRRTVRDYTWSSAIGNWQSASQTRYVCDGYLPIQERDASGNVLVTYTRGLVLSGSFQGAGGIGGLLARTDSSGSAFYHADAGGNITSLTDSNGNAVARYLYDPFGRLAGMWGPMGLVNRMQFSSWLTDRSGIIHAPFRDYDPGLQRWLNQDPSGERGGINLYGFVGNNPISRIDPLGLYFGIDDALFSLGGAVVGLSGQLAGDLISSARSGSLQFGGWEDYTGSAVGGLVGGEALLYTGPIGAGLAGGAAGNLTKQSLKNLSKKQCGFDLNSFATESVVGAATGLVPGVKIPGVTVGSSSYKKIFNDMVTKAGNGTISSVTPTTAGKMFIGRAVETGLLPGTGAAAGASGLFPSSESARPPN